MMVSSISILVYSWLLPAGSQNHRPFTVETRGHACEKAPGCRGPGTDVALSHWR